MLHFFRRCNKRKRFFLETIINNTKIKGKFIMIIIKDNQQVILTATGMPDSAGATTEILEVTAVSSDISVVDVTIVADAITVKPATPAKAGTANITISAMDLEGNKLADVVTAVTVTAQDATAFVVTASDPSNI